MKIAPEGYPFILITATITAIVYGLFGMVAVIPLFVTLFMVFFFRDPERKVPQDKDTLIAPADGKIIFMGKVREEEFLRSECHMVSIFMSPLNVHVNRVPCDCKVLAVRHKKGKFLSAFKPEAALENESISLLLDSPFGNILVRQVAGFVARRAVCRVKEGDELKRGERFGLIKFSSRVDLYLPLTLKITTELNTVVRAGESVIAVKQ